MEEDSSIEKKMSPKENLDTLSRMFSDILKVGIAWIIFQLILGWIAWQLDLVEPYDPDLTKFWIILGLGLGTGVRIAASKIERFDKYDCWIIRLSGAAMILGSFILVARMFVNG